MAHLNKTIPPFLARHGIKSISDNLQDGDEVTGFTRELVRLFGKEFMAEWNAEQAAARAAATMPPADAGL